MRGACSGRSPASWHLQVACDTRLWETDCPGRFKPAPGTHPTDGTPTRSVAAAPALQDYEAALEAQPGHPAALLNKAKVHVALKQQAVGGCQLPTSLGAGRTC